MTSIAQPVQQISSPLLDLLHFLAAEHSQFNEAATRHSNFRFRFLSRVPLEEVNDTCPVLGTPSRFRSPYCCPAIHLALCCLLPLLMVICFLSEGTSIVTDLDRSGLLSLIVNSGI